MVTNTLIKCKTCGKIFRLRWQLGYEIAEVNILCPECKTKVGATLMQKEESRFINAELCKEDEQDYDGDYLVEVSTEFLTKKISTNTNRLDPENILTPFIRTFQGKTNIEEISKFVHYGINARKLSEDFERIFDLYNSKKYLYLKKALMSEDDPYALVCRKTIKNYKLYSDLDYLVGTHHYLNALISNTLRDDTHAFKNEIMKSIMYFNMNRNSMIRFLNVLYDNKLFENVSLKFSRITCEFLNIFIDLVPVYINYDLKDVDLTSMGITTIDIEKIINIYKKCYEFLGSFVIYPIGLNNIFERNDCDLFPNGNNHLIYDFLESIPSKYNRYNDFIKKNEKFSKMFIGGLDNVIRNSEAHFDYEYDQITQKITFTNNHKGNITTKEMYMVEFAIEVINIYQKCALIWEMNYNLNKVFMINKGTKFNMGSK